MAITFLEAIEKTIAKGYKEADYSTDSHAFFLLKETAANAKCKQVQFNLNRTCKILVYKFDQPIFDSKDNISATEFYKIKHPLMFLESDSPLRAMCDYIIFAERILATGESKYEAFICNLKSNAPANRIQQMLSGELFCDYLLKTAARCYNHWNSQFGASLDFRNLDIKLSKIEIYHEIPKPVNDEYQKFNMRDFRKSKENPPKQEQGFDESTRLLDCQGVHDLF